jgi:hypothetical protein
LANFENVVKKTESVSLLVIRVLTGQARNDSRTYAVIISIIEEALQARAAAACKNKNCGMYYTIQYDVQKPAHYHEKALQY